LNHLGKILTNSERLAQADAAATARGERRESEKEKLDQEARAMSWQRGELIGAGAFGRVYLGMNEGTGELMAVKQVREWRLSPPNPGCLNPVAPLPPHWA
jgi:hypothetical protein